MNPAVKLISIIASVIIFIFITSFLLVNLLLFQLVILLFVILVCLFRFKLGKLIDEFKLFFPFVVTMLIVYILLGLFGKNYAPDVIDSSHLFKYWIMYGVERSILFISTFLFIQFALSFYTMNDILALRLKMKYKKYLILGRSLFVYSINNIGSIEFHLKLIPFYQKNKLSLKQWFDFKIQMTYAVITMILSESKIKGELIDNRISHCFEEIIK